MSIKIKYEFHSKLWQHSSSKAWYFVSLPIKMSKEIRSILKWQEEGWGRLHVRAGIGSSEWETAIWFDSKHNTYLLPVKSQIRKTEKIESNTEVKTTLWI